MGKEQKKNAENIYVESENLRKIETVFCSRKKKLKRSGKGAGQGRRKRGEGLGPKNRGVKGLGSKDMGTKDRGEEPEQRNNKYDQWKEVFRGNMGNGDKSNVPGAKERGRSGSGEGEGGKY